MSSFKFIHAADLHIESPYKGVKSLNKKLGEALVQRGFDAYDQLIETCISEKVDFLLIAGDSFDSESGSLGAQYRFFSGLEKLNQHNINVYIICGNHDPLNRWAQNFQLPENVFRFKANLVQQEVFTKGGKALASIYGVSYGEKEVFDGMADQFKRNDQHSFAIGMLHGMLSGKEGHSPYCPFTLDQLRASGMDYWALGHIHKREIIHESNPLAVYPGNIQGRHFNETGEKGCYLIEIERGTISKQTFIGLSSVIFERTTLDIDEVESMDVLFSEIDALKEQLLVKEHSYMLRITLTGSSSLYNELTDQFAVDELLKTINAQNQYEKNFVYIDRLVNNTQPIIDIEARKKASDFLADLMQRFDQHEKNPTQLKELETHLFEEIKSSKVGRSLDLLEDKETLKEVLENAKWKCISGLLNNSSR